MQSQPQSQPMSPPAKKMVSRAIALILLIVGVGVGADITRYLSNAGCNLKFAVSTNDSQLDSSIALTDLQNFAASGVQVVVGPLNSGALQNLITYANSNHIVVISPSSTSAALAIPESSTKYYFRTAPDDRWQGMADARMLQAEGA